MNNDLISREALKEEICVNTPISIDETWEQLYDAVVKAIDNAPTVPIPNEQIAWEQGYEAGLAQGKSKQGEWIELCRGIHVTDYKCSCCGRTVRDDTGYDVSKDYPFCHCGAKMRGGAE